MSIQDLPIGIYLLVLESESGQVGNHKIIKKETTESSISLINDSKDKISIHTGTGFVSLNKGSKTSIGCNVGKEVRWANEGKKGDVIFKITSEMCGKTIKLSEVAK